MNYPANWWADKAKQWHELGMLRPDWMEIVGDPDDATAPFRQWLSEKPGAYQYTINTTTSARIIAGAITCFLREKAH